jgi:hypothetical protein
VSFLVCDIHLCSIASTGTHPRTVSPVSEEDALSSIKEQLELLRSMIAKYLDEKPGLDIWQPTNVPEDIREHIFKLGIPFLRTSARSLPNLLLHNLGSDPPLSKRASILSETSQLKQVPFPIGHSFTYMLIGSFTTPQALARHG